MPTSKQLTYRDAVVLLTGEDGAVAGFVDKALGGAVIGSSLFFGPAALGLLGPKNELMKLGKGQLEGLTGRLAGRRLVTRRDLREAANAVLVVVSFLEACEEELGTTRYRELEISEQDLRNIASDGSAAKGELPPDWDILAEPAIPCPSVHRTIEETVSDLSVLYAEWIQRFLAFVRGLQAWERLPSPERSIIEENLLELVPQAGIVKYKAYLAKLAGDVPEFSFWALSQELQALNTALGADMKTVDESLRPIGSSLSSIQDLLETLTSTLPSASGSRWLQSLADMNAAELGRHLVNSEDEELEGINSPTVERGYIDPDFKAALYSPRASPSSEGWWATKPTHTDLGAYLTGHLMSTTATTLPMLIIGDPGAGKSTLARVLAARLPASGFLPVRVPLRNVAANESIDRQIVHGIRHTIHEEVSWPEFVEAAQQLLPVVILDGFDELLQATGVNHSDYLEKVADFQLLEAAQGRPVAVIVTSRTTVIERARIRSGTPIVKLAQFEPKNVKLWLREWSLANARYYRERGLVPLTWERLENYRHLAAQPVLLLMLALYDAQDNALHTESGFGRSVLYERLLRKFTRREVLKHYGALDEQGIDTEVENHLSELSLVALGMFNRGQQYISEGDVTADLTALGYSPATQPNMQGRFSQALTPGQLLLGKFFFVHNSEALDVNVEREAGRSLQLGRTFEFMHATFGEYLVARLAGNLAAALLPPDPNQPFWTRNRGSDPALFAALFSLQALSESTQTVTFLQEIFEQQRHDVPTYDVVRWMLADLWKEDPKTKYPNYQPVALTTQAKIATLSANLLLILAADNNEIDITRLFGGSPWEAHLVWRKWTLLWESQLDEGSYSGLVQLLMLKKRKLDTLDNIVYELVPTGSPRSPQDSAFLGFEHTETSLDQSLTSVGMYTPWHEYLSQRSSLCLDWEGLRSAEVVRCFEDRLGQFGSRLYFRDADDDDHHFRPGGFDEGNYGGLFMASLAFTRSNEPTFRSQVMSILEMIKRWQSEADFERPPALILLTLLSGRITWLTLDDWEKVFHELDFYPDDSPLIHQFHVLQLEIITKLWAIEGTRVMRASPLAQSAEAAWAYLDPAHMVDAEPSLAAGLLLAMINADVPIESIAPEYGTFEDWIDRIGLGKISKVDPRLGYQILVAMMHHDRHDWARHRAPNVLDALSGQTLERLSSSQVAYYVAAAMASAPEAADKLHDFVERWIQLGGSLESLEKNLSLEGADLSALRSIRSKRVPSRKTGQQEGTDFLPTGP